MCVYIHISILYLYMYIHIYIYTYVYTCIVYYYYYHYYYMYTHVMIQHAMLRHNGFQVSMQFHTLRTLDVRTRRTRRWLRRPSSRPSAKFLRRPRAAMRAAVVQPFSTWKNGVWELRAVQRFEANLSTGPLLRRSVCSQTPVSNRPVFLAAAQCGRAVSRGTTGEPA